MGCVGLAQLFSSTFKKVLGILSSKKLSGETSHAKDTVSCSRKWEVWFGCIASLLLGDILSFLRAA